MLENRVELTVVGPQDQAKEQLLTWIVVREVFDSSVRRDRSGSTMPSSRPYLEYQVILRLMCLTFVLTFLHDEELLGEVKGCWLRGSSVASQC